MLNSNKFWSYQNFLAVKLKGIRLIQNLVKFSSLHVHRRGKQSPLFKFLNFFLFEDVALKYNGGVLMT